MPRPAEGDVPRLVLPRLVRLDGAIQALDGTPLAVVMAARRAALRREIERLAPDVVLVEHFPLAKWSLRAEVTALVAHAKTVRPTARIVCSLRDVPAASSDVPPTPEDALRVLDESFDLVLVHGDPRVLALEASVPWARKIAIAVEHTGIISEKTSRAAAGRGGGVVVSAGGAGGAELRGRAIEAWRLLAGRATIPGGELVVFGSIEGSDADETREPGIRIVRFSVDFLASLRGARVSISQAGYNTCANILEARARAILVPDPTMVDQVIRARRLAELGAATVIPIEELSPERLADEIERAGARAAPEVSVDLDGARRTRALLEASLPGP